MINTVEENRVKALKKYSILDTPPDGTYDLIVSTVAKILDVPIALVSLVDTDRIWFKSSFGLTINEMPRENGNGLCASAILSDEFYMIEDAIKDPRTLNNILVKSDFGLQFYAAAPLTTSDGYNLGNICVIDKKPRNFNAFEKGVLSNFAKIIMEQLELQLKARLTISSEINREYMLLHETKTALCYIPAILKMLHKNNDITYDSDLLIEMVINSTNIGIEKINEVINKIKNKTLIKNEEFDTFDFIGAINQIIEKNIKYAKLKNQDVEFLPTNYSIKVYGDKNKLIELMDNLISNAIKYSTENTTIKILINEKNENLYIKVIDEGLGMTEDDIENAFKRFKKLSAIPTANETSTGLGLWIIKEICELHNGTVTVESEGLNKGSTFTVNLPIRFS